MQCYLCETETKDSDLRFSSVVDETICIVCIKNDFYLYPYVLEELEK